MSINEKKKVWVVGHKNPDTDSICAAIAYANLKNQADGNRYEAKRAGELNEETKYALEFMRFLQGQGIRVPEELVERESTRRLPCQTL